MITKTKNKIKGKKMLIKYHRNIDINKLKQENKALKETCEILGNSKIMKELKKSLEDFKKGRYITLENHNHNQGVTSLARKSRSLPCTYYSNILSLIEKEKLKYRDGSKEANVLDNLLTQINTQQEKSISEKGRNVIRESKDTFVTLNDKPADTFCLSDKRITFYRDMNNLTCPNGTIKTEDVKEFIKRLKDEIGKDINEFKEYHTLSRSLYPEMFFNKIDKLAGDELI